MFKSAQELTTHLVNTGVLKSRNIIEAFLKIDRRYFVTKDFISLCYEDMPLPIGYCQTISQPSTVAFMLELLLPQKSDHILDIGSGSGWTTALLCEIVGEKGSVIGLERIEELVKLGNENLSKFDFKSNCIIQKAGKNIGLKGKVFDKILISASANSYIDALTSQVKVWGKIVMPIKNSIFLFQKTSEESMKKSEFPGFIFVPLICEEER